MSFSVTDIRKLLNADFAEVSRISYKTHVALPPYYINQLDKGIATIIDKKIRRYDERLDGIIIGYDNVKLSQKTGTFFYDQPYIHWDVDVDYYVFCPTVGCLLKAKVNKLSKGHIGCIVHNCFNVSLPNTVLITLSVGQEIIFEVTQLDTIRNIIKLKGIITLKSLELMEQNKMVKSSIKIKCENDVKDEIGENDEEACELSANNTEYVGTKKKKKKKRKKECSIKTESTVDDIVIDAIVKESKRKKEKSRKSVDANLSVHLDRISDCHVEDDNLESETKRKKSKRKRRKHSIDGLAAESSVNEITNAGDELDVKCEKSSSIGCTSSVNDSGIELVTDEHFISTKKKSDKKSRKRKRESSMIETPVKKLKF